MDRADLRPGVGGNGGGVEGRVFDVVAHGYYVVGTQRLDVHQGPTVIQPELAMVMVGDPVAEVHELRRCADLDLHSLEDRLDRVAFEAQCPLHPLGVDGAGSHPLLDGDIAHCLHAECSGEVRHTRPIDQMAGQ